MKRNTSNIIKSYFEEEVSFMKVPPLPTGLVRKNEKNHVSKGDSLILAAIFFVSLLIISLPGVYESQIRKVYIPIGKIDAFKEELPRLLFEASIEYKERKGV